MTKIRIGTDIMFRIKISSDTSFPHIFNKSIQQVIPLLMSSRNSCSCETLTATSTGQCCGTNFARTSHILRTEAVKIVSEKELIIDVIFLGEEQRRPGSMDLQLTWVEGDLGSERSEQLRYTVDLPNAVEMVRNTEQQDLDGVFTENGRLITQLEWTFSTK